MENQVRQGPATLIPTLEPMTPWTPPAKHLLLYTDRSSTSHQPQHTGPGSVPDRPSCSGGYHNGLRPASWGSGRASLRSITAPGATDSPTHPATVSTSPVSTASTARSGTCSARRQHTRCHRQLPSVSDVSWGTSTPRTSPGKGASMSPMCPARTNTGPPQPHGQGPQLTVSPEDTRLPKNLGYEGHRAVGATCTGERG